ncbi:MAG: hypothetical protein WBM90_12970 [Acidimicrobiia bacterium]
MRRLIPGLIATFVFVATAPATAMAHGIGGRLDLPVPLEFFVVGGAVVLVISFVALALLWPEPRLQDGPRYVGTGLRARLHPILATVGVVSLLVVIGQVVPDVFGIDRDPTRPTIAPVTMWVVFWLVVPFASALIGNWYADLNPWRTFGSRATIDRPRVLHRVGVWPATFVFVGVTWFELVSPSSGDPAALGIAALGYTVYLILVMGLVGRESGLTSFDAFTIYNRLFSAISPLGRRADGKMVWRGWLRSLTVLPEWRGLWVFVVAMIGTVSYDGASGTNWFGNITFGLLETTGGQTVLLVLSVAVVALGFWVASWMAARLSGGRHTASSVVQRFAHTLVPIALAYAFAHYFTLIIFEGQQLIAAISDPFGLGWDVFGTAERGVDFFIRTSQPIWYIQVTSIVGGHLLGVVLAHDRALADFGRDAVRSQYAMLVLMVGLTALGLTILAG